MEQNKKFDDFLEIYMNTHEEDKQYAILGDFLLTCSLKELFAWNDFLESKSDFEALVARGLTEEDHAFFRAQFAKFDALEAQLNLRRAA